MGANISLVFFGGQELHHHTPAGTFSGCSESSLLAQVPAHTLDPMGHVLLWSGISFAIETLLFLSRIMVNFL